MSNVSAIQREAARMKKEAQEREELSAVQNHEQADASEKARKAFEESEQGEVARQNAEAYRIMRLPTPEALKELGSVTGDPLKGPSS